MNFFDECRGVIQTCVLILNGLLCRSLRQHYLDQVYFPNLGKTGIISACNIKAPLIEWCKGRLLNLNNEIVAKYFFLKRIQLLTISYFDYHLKL